MVMWLSVVLLVLRRVVAVVVAVGIVSTVDASVV